MIPMTRMMNNNIIERSVIVLGGWGGTVIQCSAVQYSTIPNCDRDTQCNARLRIVRKGYQPLE